jgi:hypothetical protein
MPLSKEDIQQAEKRVREKPVKVHIETWGLDVFVRFLAAEEVSQWSEANDKKETNFRARLIVQALCDEHGNKLYKPEDVGIIGSFISVVVDELWEAVCQLNIIREVDLKKKVSSLPTDA